VDALEAWIDEGMLAAHERWGAPWAAAFPMGLAQAFLWSGPGDGKLLCGVLAPSRDAVGRDYPLAVASRFSVDVTQGAPHVAPLAFGDLLEASYAVVDDARRAPMNVEELAHRLAHIPSARADDVALARAEYDAWCSRTPMEQAWGAVFQAPDPLAYAAVTLHSLRGVLASIRGREAPRTPIGVRLPLGRGGPAAAALWLDVVRRMCRWALTVPTAFWSAEQGVLSLYVGAVGEGALGDLWPCGPGTRGGEVFDLAGPAAEAEPTSQVLDQVSFVDRAFRGAPVAAFLESLAR
jgi:type VI secretion system protein ImpM